MTENPELEYDELTCYTAGEIRRMGANVPDHIPDCAWIPRTDFHLEQRGTSLNSDMSMTMDFYVHITAPFKWVEVNITATRKEDGEDTNGKFENKT